jgi:hypothetical protein
VDHLVRLGRIRMADWLHSHVGDDTRRGAGSLGDAFDQLTGGFQGRIIAVAAV